MKRFFSLTLIAIGCACVGHAQATGSVAWIYDLKYIESSTVVLKPIGTLHNVIGKDFDLDVDAFAGLTLVTKKPVSGFLIGKRIALADNVQGYFGGGLNLPADKNPSVVFGAGVTWKF